MGVEDESQDQRTWQADQTPAWRDAPPRTDAPPTPGDRTVDQSGGTGGSNDGSANWDKSPPPSLNQGEVVFGDYELLNLLGEGGMGQVWLVQNLKMESKRALKLIKPDLARNDRGWRRFKREAQVMDKLRHPGAVRVYRYDRAQSMGFIEMEYVAGQSLDKVLRERRGKPLKADWIVPFLDQLCAVLQDAHEHADEESGKRRPIIHRDLKPSNLMLVDKKPPGKNLKVLDFGIAKMLGDDETVEEQLTVHGDFLGTVAYCSPEQIRDAGRSANDPEGSAVDGRSDLYSVGVILYQLLTGQTPFKGPAQAVLAAHISEPPPPMNKVNPDAKVPPAIERVVRMCLAKNREERPGDALELARLFREAAGIGEPRPWPLPLPPSWLILAASVLIAGMVAAPRLRDAWSGKPAVTGNGSGGTGNGVESEPPKETVKPKSVASQIWEPPGYVASDRDEVVRGARYEPKALKRETDGIVFQRLAEGVYLPDRLEPEDDQRNGGWPAALIRSEDRKRPAAGRPRFLRIAGKTYLRGDPREGDPAEDDQGRPCVPHWVQVAPFYLQQTEVTNRDVEEFAKKYPDEEPALEEWRNSFEAARRELGDIALRLPAVNVRYATAVKVARYFQGRLPTEAEWELAAKSGVDDFLWPWGKTLPTQKTRLRVRLFNEIKTWPDEVGKNPDDRNDQGILDLAGNVRELCLGPYAPYSDGVAPDNDSEKPLVDRPWDLPAPTGQQDVVARGGSLKDDMLKDVMVFRRWTLQASEGLPWVGFRIVIDVPRH